MYIWLSTVINAKECTTLNVRSSSFLKNCLKILWACRKWQKFWRKIHSNELDERILRAVLRHATRVGTWFTRKGRFRGEVEWTNIFGLTRERKIFISLYYVAKRFADFIREAFRFAFAIWRFISLSSIKMNCLSLRGRFVNVFLMLESLEQNSFLNLVSIRAW